MVSIVGLGIEPSDLTEGAKQELLSGKKIIVRAERFAAAVRALGQFRSKRSTACTKVRAISILSIKISPRAFWARQRNVTSSTACPAAWKRIFPRRSS